MLGIIILNYNNASATVDCVNSVLEHNTWPAKFILVDNASTDDSVSRLTSYLSESRPDDHAVFAEEDSFRLSELPRFSLVKAGVNGGYARGNNIGLRFAEKDDSLDLVMILNNDILFIDDIIPLLARFVMDDANAGLVSPLLLKRDGKSLDYNCARKDCDLGDVALYYLFYCRDRKGILSRRANEKRMLYNDRSLLEKDAVPIELPSGSCMLVRKDHFRRAGYFDPETFLYYEENILYHRFRKLGLTNYLLPQLKCIHLGAETTAKAVRDYDYLRKTNRSAYYYVMNYRDLNPFQKVFFFLLYNVYCLVLRVRQSTKRR